MMMTTRGTRAAPTGPDARILRDARTGQAGPIQACPGDPVAPAFAPADLRIDAAALAAIEEAIEGSPFDTLLLRHRADVLWYLGRYEEAIDAYEQAMAANPADSMSIVGRNECLAALGRRTEVRARP